MEIRIYFGLYIQMHNHISMCFLTPAAPVASEEGFPKSRWGLVVVTKHEAYAVLPKLSSCLWSPHTGALALTLQVADAPALVLPGGWVTWLGWDLMSHWVPLLALVHISCFPFLQALTCVSRCLHWISDGSWSKKDWAHETMVCPRTEGHWKPLLQ